MDTNRLDQIITDQRGSFIAASDRIWEYAEMRFAEYQSAELLSSLLADAGFCVTRHVADMATAFVAEFGTGKPVIAILGEFDALSGLSQKSGIAKQEAIKEGGTGHGCGHNLLGTGSLAAAIAVKQYMAENKISGTIRYYGCPGEEGGSGKTFMARAGLFNDVDLALTWHPFTHNAIMSVQSLANYQIYYKFHGRSAHAAAVPHLGRSALDSVELMNVGVNYLREHIIQEARIHYAVTNTGGNSPNVVQAEAEVLYLIRAPRISQVQEIYERVCDIAKGAALMAGTECEIVFDKACSNFIPNQVLERSLYAHFNEVGTPEFDEADRKFAGEIKQTFSQSDITNDLRMANGYMGGNSPETLETLKNKVIADILLPYAYSSMLLSGSTDVGDVSWLVPTAQISVACQAFGTPGHSWQIVAQGVSPLAHKGMLTAAKVMARTAVEALENPELVKLAQAELQQTLAGEKYVCPIPAGVKPSAVK